MTPRKAYNGIFENYLDKNCVEWNKNGVHLELQNSKRGPEIQKKRFFLIFP